MKKSIVLFAGVLTVWSGFAQSPIFSKTAETYVPLTGATQVMKDSVWDDTEDWKMSERQINLGFTFKAFNRSITQFLWEDGAVSSNVGDTVILVGLGADLCDYGFGSNISKSPVYKKTEGSAGSRIVKLQWTGFGFWDDWYKNGSCKDSANLQLWIYEEAPQKIELRFGPRNVANFSAIFPDKLPVICAKYDNFGNTQGMVLDGNPINPTTHAFADTGTRGLTSWPVANQVYIFNFGATGNTLNAEQESIKMYFSHGYLISKGINEPTPLEIFGADGRTMMATEMVNGISSVKTLAPGTYLAVLKHRNTPQYLRFVYTGE